MERELQRLNWLELRDQVPSQIDTIILPIGTVEAHGTSCTGTDNIIPDSIAYGIADRINALVAPVLGYGITKSLRRYSGALTINPDTFGNFVRDILDSLVAMGFKNIIIMNGHGGNNSVLKSVAYQFHSDVKANIAIIHWWELCGKMTEEFFGHVGGHGGTDETALVMAVDPKLADKEAYDPDIAYTFVPGADVYPVPGTILLYKEGEGYPEFDQKKNLEYQKKVFEKVGDFVEMVLERWRKYNK